ncbi:hypothetical protein FKW77_002410 [Venturia effusa]|uniref:BTB domain-containing protein n=1 Tax=Venturia effusa TaxID=50376 RepID=A0A517LNG9_9PEZI|nr:hypothetical protein FKW77_002410 [Venturia effusa]
MPPYELGLSPERLDQAELSKKMKSSSWKSSPAPGATIANTNEVAQNKDERQGTHFGTPDRSAVSKRSQSFTRPSGHAASPAANAEEDAPLSTDISMLPVVTATSSGNASDNMNMTIIKKEHSDEDEASLPQVVDLNASEDDEESQLPSIDDETLSYLDPNGDLKLRLRIEDKEHVFVVSSARMQYASRVWGTLIQELPPALSGGMREMSLLMDNGNAILILINIAHGRFRNVDHYQPVDLIHDLASICEQYECSELVMPHVASWINVAFPLISEAELLKWIRTSWVFGCELIFGACLKYIVLNSYFVGQEEGDRELHVNEKAIYGYLPAGIQKPTLENIILCRSSLLEQLTQECDAASRFSTWENYGSCRDHVCSTWSFGCFSRQMQILEKNLGVPVSKMNEAAMSATKFAGNLLSLEAEPFPTVKSHTCKFDDFKYRISRVLYDVDLGVSLGHKDHFESLLFTKYSQVVGSAYSAIGLLPLDFEHFSGEEADERFRPGITPFEPPEEYLPYDDAAFEAEENDMFPANIGVGEDRMDLDSTGEDDNDGFDDNVSDLEEEEDE